MRTTKAFGTSWTSRQGSPQIEIDDPHGVRRRRIGVGDASAAREGLGLGRADLDLGAEHRGDARAGRGHHLVHGLGDGGELELGELGGVRVLRLVHAHHRGGELARAVERDHEDVAAGDAVDVGDAASRRPGPARTQRVALGRRRRVTSPADDLARARTSRARRRIASAVDWPSRISASSLIDGLPTRPVTCTARRLPLRPGLAGVDGHLVGVERDAAGGGRVEPQQVAGLQREHVPRSAARPTATSARTVISTLPTARRTRGRVVLGARPVRVVAGGELVGHRRDRRPRDQQRQRRGDAAAAAPPS